MAYSQVFFKFAHFYKPAFVTYVPLIIQ